ncbi:undecaprenyl-diphosphate phosphatase [Lentisphaera profundi]|uniref:Undecaprenyl-diphosphatase n=1 Tax=Lentisphaera profundi TaxID=1658616 RepID=A0ABY7VXM3_9BACT|nr:undecaprenyl-diphosphate phosphatase [Lentisphaera profundi]WDE97464.1 undecaprenyl-diphosphate phosphatase [Lentisphaera profundi]
MNDFFNMLIIGIVQGLTEFLPVSSSGHLVIFGDLLGLKQNGIALEVFVHFGTLLAVCTCFYKDIIRLIKELPRLHTHIANKMPNDSEDEQYRSMNIYILISMIPAGIIGVFFKDYLEKFYHNLYLVFSCLMVTGFILLSLKWSKKRKKKPFMNAKDSLLIGIGQAIAILPGISRSGTTISIAEALGIKSALAAKFSFLMSIPVIAGITILELKDLVQQQVTQAELINYAIAMTSAAISGFFAIKFLMIIIRKQRMEYFAYYCFLAAIVGLVLNLQK